MRSLGKNTVSIPSLYLQTHLRLPESLSFLSISKEEVCELYEGYLAYTARNLVPSVNASLSLVFTLSAVDLGVLSP